MCVLSMVIDQGQKTWPWPTSDGFTSSPIYQTIEVERVPTAEEWKAFLDLVEKAKKFDELTGQPDCEDPAKLAWMEEVERRLAELEATNEPEKTEPDPVQILKALQAGVDEALRDANEKDQDTPVKGGYIANDLIWRGQNLDYLKESDYTGQAEEVPCDGQCTVLGHGYDPSIPKWKPQQKVFPTIKLTAD